MARSPRHAGVLLGNRGFNEPGVNLEQTVHREVGEEVGIAGETSGTSGEPGRSRFVMIGFVADSRRRDPDSTTRLDREAAGLPGHPPSSLDDEHIEGPHRAGSVGGLKTHAPGRTKGSD